jgi:hypothetical protein
MSVIKQANALLKLWQDYGPDEYPVDLDLVVAELVNRKSGEDRLQLKFQPLRDADGAMMRSRENSTRFTAFVNSNVRNRGRRRFTMAHEIGHFVLHCNLQDSFLCTREMLEDFKVDTLEAEANAFASQLLLPPNRIREFEKHPWNVETLKDIAEKFEVSLQAAGLRMTALSGRKIGFVVSVSDFVEWGSASPSLYKSGCFFKNMMEVPENSTAYGAEFTDERLEKIMVLDNSWRIHESFKEESIAGFDGRIYTCIDVS